MDCFKVINVMSKIGLISDAHGNGAAFKIALDALRKARVDSVYYLGDAIGYIPSLSVLEQIRAYDGIIHCIKGNHEKMFLSGSVDDRLEKVYLLSEIREEYSQRFDGFLDSWVDSISIKNESLSVLMVHGSPNDYSKGYVYPDTDLSAFHCDGYQHVFMGHTHRPFIRVSKGIHYINVGSCGLPRDHGCYGSAVIFDTKSGESNLIRFDIKKTLSQIDKKHPNIHHSVKNLFKRKSDSFDGEIVC